MSNTNKTKGLGFRCSEEQTEKILKASKIQGVKYSTLARNATLAIADHIIELHEDNKLLDDKIIGKYVKNLETENKKKV